MTLTRQPGYVIYEYGCHEGNGAVRNSLSGERAYEKRPPRMRRRGFPRPNACSSASTETIAGDSVPRANPADSDCG